MKTITRIISYLQYPRSILHIILRKISPEKVVIDQDIERWLQVTQNYEQSRLPKGEVESSFCGNIRSIVIHSTTV